MNVCMLALLTLQASHSVPIIGESCLSSGYTRAWNDLFENVSVYPGDSRYGMHQGAPKHGLSSEEKDWVENVTGRIWCPRPNGQRRFAGTASLVGRNDQLVTNSHILMNEQGDNREEWGSCYFESYARPGDHVSFSSPNSTNIGTRKWAERGDLDFAVLQLHAPIKGVEPIKIAPNAGALKEGDRLLMVSAEQDRMKKNRKVLPNEPVIQSCKVGGFIRSYEDVAGGGVKTNCSGTLAASAAIVFARDGQKRLVGVGIHSGGQTEAFDNRAPSYGQGGNYSTTLTFEGPFLKLLTHSDAKQTSL